METLNVATPSASTSLMAERYCGAGKAERDEDIEAKGGEEGGDEGGEEKDAEIADNEEDVGVDNDEVEDDVEEEVVALVVEAENNAEDSCRMTLHASVHHHVRARACTRSRKNRKMGLSRVCPNGIWYVVGVAARTTA